ncbi:hypothetical protein Shel_22520 [Slackia heliotrinireducens DSM 20476]|uniref:Uncharacterized protein n=1 Tax=Slackia heliotrinireducens (strain ATCC 29202 / DSM 20476 / NCTC 11029 / RHS 1) TaxID=471855 RepID=C7N140_SLAHD|nr:hypothetical protein Shel_22520 [Slackia heliotrinireducens DSM 20476]
MFYLHACRAGLRNHTLAGHTEQNAKGAKAIEAFAPFLKTALFCQEKQVVYDLRSERIGLEMCMRL